MGFIRPRILRDDEQAAIETNSKYNYMRDVQRLGRGGKGGRVAIMPGEDRPVLPPIEEMMEEQASEEDIQLDVQQ